MAVVWTICTLNEIDTTNTKNGSMAQKSGEMTVNFNDQQFNVQSVAFTGHRTRKMVFVFAIHHPFFLTKMCIITHTFTLS